MRSVLPSIRLYVQKLVVPSIVSLILPLASVSFAYDTKDVPLKAEEKPAGLENVGIKENLGKGIDLSLKFTNEKGELVTLQSLMESGKPTILSFVYYSCPNLCNLHLNGLNDGLKKLKWSVGEEFNVVAISFDSRESYKVAAEKKKSYLSAYGRVSGEKGWNFLTGSKEAIDELAERVGFSFKWLEEESEWSHASAAIMLTPDGTISRYLHGVFFEKQNLRLALAEASEGKVGNIIDRIVLYCFRFDPKKNKYTLYAYNIMKAGATATVVLMALFMFPVWLRERKNSKSE